VLLAPWFRFGQEGGPAGQLANWPRAVIDQLPAAAGGKKCDYQLDA